VLLSQSPFGYLDSEGAHGVYSLDFGFWSWRHPKAIVLTEALLQVNPAEAGFRMRASTHVFEEGRITVLPTSTDSEVATVDLPGSYSFLDIQDVTPAAPLRRPTVTVRGHPPDQTLGLKATTGLDAPKVDGSRTAFNYKSTRTVNKPASILTCDFANKAHKSETTAFDAGKLAVIDRGGSLSLLHIGLR